MTRPTFWTIAWFTLCVVLALHIYEEATIASGVGLDLLRAFFPSLPPFQYEIWLIDIVGSVIALFALTIQVQKRNPWMRPASFALATFTAANAMMHMLSTIALKTPVAGTITAPALLAAAFLLFVAIPRGELAADNASRRDAKV